MAVKNLEPVEFPKNLDWTGKPAEAADALFDYGNAVTTKTIEWYMERKSGKRIGSRICRFGALILTTLGGLIPIIQVIAVSKEATLQMKAPWLGQGGYVCFALVAALLAWDRFAGLSSGWTRYIKTALNISALQRNFQLDWQLTRSANPLDPHAVIDRCKAFCAAVDKEIQAETDAWITEFQNAQAELDKMANKQLEQQRPGTLVVQVAAGVLADNGVTVLVDGVKYAENAKQSDFRITPIPSGIHFVQVRGKFRGTEASANTTVTVSAGTTANAAVTLPLADVEVTLTNFNDTTDDVSVILNGAPLLQNQKQAKYFLKQIAVGTYRLRVEGTLNGKQAVAEDLVTVQAGETAAVAVSLKERSA